MNAFKSIFLLEDNNSTLKKIQWVSPLGGVDNVYMPPQFFGQQFATIFIVRANVSHEVHHVYVINP